MTDLRKPDIWLDRLEQWDKLATALLKAGEFGYDTETFNQPDKTSPQHRARIHCFSVGLLGTTRNARGYRNGFGRVLPRAALDFPPLRLVFEDPSVLKWAHNAPHDIHSTLNEGIAIANCQDSLQLLRVAFPGRAAYGLKEAEVWALGLGTRPSFLDTVTHEIDIVTARGKSHKGCICGKSPCRAKSTSDFLSDDGVWRPHIRVGWRTFTPIHRKAEARWEVPEFVPGHPRWVEWLEYSLADAVRGIMLVDWIRNQRPRRVAYPWTGLVNSNSMR